MIGHYEGALLARTVGGWGGHGAVGLGGLAQAGRVVVSGRGVESRWG